MSVLPFIWLKNSMILVCFTRQADFALKLSGKAYVRMSIFFCTYFLNPSLRHVIGFHHISYDGKRVALLVLFYAVDPFRIFPNCIPNFLPYKQCFYKTTVNQKVVHIYSYRSVVKEACYFTQIGRKLDTRLTMVIILL